MYLLLRVWVCLSFSKDFQFIAAGQQGPGHCMPSWQKDFKCDLRVYCEPLRAMESKTDHFHNVDLESIYLINVIANRHGIRSKQEVLKWFSPQPVGSLGIHYSTLNIQSWWTWGSQTQLIRRVSVPHFNQPINWKPLQFWALKPLPQFPTW